MHKQWTNFLNSPHEIKGLNWNFGNIRNLIDRAELVEAQSQAKQVEPDESKPQSVSSESAKSSRPSTSSGLTGYAKPSAIYLFDTLIPQN